MVCAGLLSSQGGESSLDSDSVLIGVPRLIVSSVGGAPSRTGQKNTSSWSALFSLAALARLFLVARSAEALQTRVRGHS